MNILIRTINKKYYRLIIKNNYQTINIMGTIKQKSSKRTGFVSATLIIFLCAVIAFTFFKFVAGNPENFDAKGHPITTFGTLFMGGWVIPIVITLLLTVFALAVERTFAMSKAKGKGNLTKFVGNIKNKLEAGDIKGAHELCDKQKGCVANIVRAGLIRYEDVKDSSLTNDEKAALVAAEIEEATSLELPIMEKNLPIIATISTLGTLMGLFGTVLGMIKSFGAMGQEGAPDSTALAVGISEALMNTAMGIGTGATAIIVYGFFAAKVQNITNAVNEIGYAIGQTFVTGKK
jgi:biopolymer transport protein ExbB